MTANVTASIDGATIGNGASGIGNGLVQGIYVVASLGVGDPLIATDFAQVKYADVNIGGLRPTTIRVDSVTANQINIVPGASFVAGRATAHIIGTP